MRVTTLLSLLSAATAACGQEYTAHKLYQLDNGTWLENMAQRTGQSYYLRFTRLDSPEVMEVDPTHQHGDPRTVHTFDGATNATGITELSRDNYAVLTLNQAVDATTVSLWTLQMNASSPIATKVADKVAGSALLNGLAVVSPNIVLATDTLVGGIVRIDLRTGEADKVLEGDAFTKGVNGLKYSEPYLYYTNSLEGVFGRVSVDPSTGEPTGEAEVIASGDVLVGADDFALAYWTEAAFVVNFENNNIVRVNFDNGTAEVVVKDIPAPTSATFGSSGGLYAVTSGTGSDGGASFWSIYVPDETYG